MVISRHATLPGPMHASRRAPGLPGCAGFLCFQKGGDRGRGGSGGGVGRVMGRVVQAWLASLRASHRQLDLHTHPSCFLAAALSRTVQAGAEAVNQHPWHDQNNGSRRAGWQRGGCKGGRGGPGRSCLPLDDASSKPAGNQSVGCQLCRLSHAPTGLLLCAHLPRPFEAPGRACTSHDRLQHVARARGEGASQPAMKEGFEAGGGGLGADPSSSFLDDMGLSGGDATRLTAPIKEVRDKYQLLPAFLRVRGLVRQVGPGWRGGEPGLKWGGGRPGGPWEGGPAQQLQHHRQHCC